MRDKIPDSKKCRTRTISCLDPEWAAIHRMRKALGVHTPFDVFRHLFAAVVDPVAIKEQRRFEPPRMKPAPRKKKRVASD